jgi:Tfp pilus assembly protein PilV
MVAVAILAMVLVSLLGLKSRSVQDVAFAEHMTTATLLAKRIMTETVIATPLVPQEKEGEFTEEEFKDYLWKKIVVPTPLPAVLEVRVAVLWREGGREEMVELISYE